MEGDISLLSHSFDRLSIHKITRTTNRTLHDTHPPSAWRVRTGQEADGLWGCVGSGVPPVVINAEELRRLAKDPDVAVRVPEQLGHGSDAFVAGFAVFYYRHCPDKLRKEISYRHYFEADEGLSPGGQLHAAHVGHCLDVLAQALKCTGSVDLITFNWVEGHNKPQPDFSNHKVCRDFDAILQWASIEGVDFSEFLEAAPSPPPGAILVPQT